MSPSYGPDARLRHGLTVTCLTLTILVLVYLILRELTEILLPLLIAVFVCYLIVPAHRWLVRHRLPSLVSHAVIVGGFLAVAYGVVSMTVRNLGQLSAELPRYAYQLEAMTDAFHQKVTDHLTKMLDREPKPADDEAAADAEMPASIEPEPPAEPASAWTTDETDADADAVPAVSDADVASPATRPAASSVRPQLISAQQVVAFGRSTLTASLGLMTTAMVVVFYLIFLLAEAAGFERRLASAFGAERAQHIMQVVTKINTMVAQYIAVKTFVSLVIAALTTIILMLFGVDYALMWGILTFFANFIPYLGSIVAAALPVAMSCVQLGEWWRPLLLAMLLTVAQLLTGNVLEPRLVGKRLGVSPLVILLSLAFWGYLWGIPGMLLAAPLMVTVIIILDNIEQTKPIARLCSSE